MKWIVLLDMITMYLVRHGQTEENLQRIFQGHLPGVLTEEGRLQALGLQSQLQKLPIDAVISSDLQRVVDTVLLAFNGTMDMADSIMESSEVCYDKLHSLTDGKLIPWVKTQMLREIDWGSWTGLPVSAVDTTKLPHDAETKEMLYARAGYFVKYLKQHYEGKIVLVVAHGLVNRSIQAQIEGVTVDHLYDVPHMGNAEMRKFLL